MAIMSTVGYGDIFPSSSSSRIFTLFMVAAGVGFVFSSVAGLITLVTTPATQRGRALLERLFPQKGVDLEGDGVPDFYEPRHPVIYYAKNLLPSLMLTLILQFVSAAVFMHIDPSNFDFGSAMYHCLITATTIGLGDVKNETQSGRLWACFHILLSVALLGELIQTFDELRAKRAKTQARIHMLCTRLNSDMLDHLQDHAIALRPLVQRDGLGLTELEFVLAMMLELRVVEMEQVQPFIKQFRLLDVDGNTRLNRKDLELSADKSLAELQLAAVKRMKGRRPTLIPWTTASVDLDESGKQADPTRTAVAMPVVEPPPPAEPIIKDAVDYDLRVEETPSAALPDAQSAQMQFQTRQHQRPHHTSSLRREVVLSDGTVLTVQSV